MSVFPLFSPTRIPSKREFPSLHMATFVSPVLNSYFVFAFLWSVGMYHDRAGEVMQLKAAVTVRGELWSDLLVSQTAEGWAGTEDVCAPGKPKGAYGSVRRPHETAEGKELHLLLPRKTQSEVKWERRGRKCNHRILQNLTAFTHNIPPFLFFALVF